MALDSFKTDSSSMNTRKKVWNIKLPEPAWKHYLEVAQCYIPKSALMELDDNEIAAIIKFAKNEMAKDAPFGDRSLSSRADPEEATRSREEFLDNIDDMEDYLEQRE